MSWKEFYQRCPPTRLWGTMQGTTTSPVQSCVHKFDEANWDGGHLIRCQFCGHTEKREGPAYNPAVALHHRSCALRVGGDLCTC